jgi:hypothetical protein
MRDIYNIFYFAQKFPYLKGPPTQEGDPYCFIRKMHWAAKHQDQAAFSFSSPLNGKKKRASFLSRPALSWKRLRDW